MEKPNSCYSKAWGILQNTRPEDIRPVDYLEYLDQVRMYPGHEVFTPDDFPAILASGIGLLSLGTKVVIFEDDFGPCFIATSIKRPECNTLCGIGWDAADHRLDKATKLQIAKLTVQDLIWADKSVSRWQCFVRNDNHNTLRTWRFIERMCKDGLDITFTPLGDTYTHVSIRRKLGCA
jgi:hypothetical protein